MPRGLVAIVLPRERVLQLVLGQIGRVLGLAVVALGGQLEVRLALVVALQPLVADLPADRAARDDGAEGMADPRRVGAVAAKGAGLGAPVRVAQHEPVAGRLQPQALALDGVHQPVAALDVEEIPFRELGLAQVRVRRSCPTRLTCTSWYSTATRAG